MKRLLTVLRKEFTEMLRDRRALSMLMLFVLMYPALLWMSVHRAIDTATRADRETTDIVLIGAAQVPALAGLLAQNNINAATRDAMSEAEIAELLRARRHAAVIRVAPDFTEKYAAMLPAPIELWYDSAADQRARLRRVESVLKQYGASIAQARLLAHGVSPVVLGPLRLQQYDTASTASRSASFVGMILGMFFATAFFLSLNTAMDTTAGERERRSLELLMAQPVRPLEIIGGKWLATASLSMVGLALELLLAHVILKWLPLEEIGMSWSLGLPQLALIWLVSLPLCLFAAGLQIALAMNARSFKEAQTMMTFVVLIPMLPAIVVPMLDVRIADWMYAVPVLAHQTLLAEVAKGQAVGALAWIGTAGTSLLAAAACIAFATWRLRSERYVLAV